jgi:hypothetical protein
LPFTDAVLFLTAEELQALKEEFNHHQDKIDQYYSLLKDVEQPNDTYESKLNAMQSLFSILLLAFLLNLCVATSYMSVGVHNVCLSQH